MMNTLHLPVFVGACGFVLIGHCFSELFAGVTLIIFERVDQ